jgi:hypothetical protein
LHHRFYRPHLPRARQRVNQGVPNRVHPVAHAGACHARPAATIESRRCRAGPPSTSRAATLETGIFPEFTGIYWNSDRVFPQSDSTILILSTIPVFQYSGFAIQPPPIRTLTRPPFSPPHVWGGAGGGSGLPLSPLAWERGPGGEGLASAPPPFSPLQIGDGPGVRFRSPLPIAMGRGRGWGTDRGSGVMQVTRRPSPT